MIRFEHINLVVENIDTSLRFYRAAFPHWYVRLEGKGTWYGTARRWCHFGDEYNFITFNDNGKSAARDLQSNVMGLAHIGFEVVDLSALELRLESAGFKCSHQGPQHQFRRNLYFIDPSGIEVEFVQYTSDKPEQRNSV